MSKIAFATCVQLGLSCIEEIYNIGGHVDLLITLKDDQAKDKSGRVYLDQLAARENAPLLKTSNINDQEVLEKLQTHQIDWLFIIGWSQIAKKEVLEAPTYGCIGMHPTLLPVGRGRAAIPWAIIKGLDKTGVTMFKLDEGVDTGAIIDQQSIELDNRITATELYGKVEEAHLSLLSRNLEAIVKNTVSFTEQEESHATEWPGRTPEDGEISNDMTMDEVDKLVRAVTHPYPGAYYISGDEKIIIWSAETDEHQGQIKLKDGFLTPIEYDIEAPS